MRNKSLASKTCDLDALCGITFRFQKLSPTQGQVAHALLTRPPLISTRRCVTVRLECVMHAASVHPEPGSNSQTNCISSAVAVRFVWAIYLSFLYFFRVVFSLVLTDFVFALAKFALYFYLLLFNCQVSITLAFAWVRSRFRVSLSIISLLNPLVNTFFEISLKIFWPGFELCLLPFLRQPCYYTTTHLSCQYFFEKLFKFFWAWFFWRARGAFRQKSIIKYYIRAGARRPTAVAVGLSLPLFNDSSVLHTVVCL